MTDELDELPKTEVVPAFTKKTRKPEQAVFSEADEALLNQLRGAMLLESGTIFALNPFTREQGGEGGDSIFYLNNPRVLGGLDGQAIAGMLTRLTGQEFTFGDRGCGMDNGDTLYTIMRCPLAGNEAAYDHNTCLSKMNAAGIKSRAIGMDKKNQEISYVRGNPANPYDPNADVKTGPLR